MIRNMIQIKYQYFETHQNCSTLTQKETSATGSISRFDKRPGNDISDAVGAAFNKVWSRAK